MFEKQFDLGDWMSALEQTLGLAGDNLSSALEAYAHFLKQVAEQYRGATSQAERRRELAFMLHLAATLNQHVVAQLVEETLG